MATLILSAAGAAIGGAIGGAVLGVSAAAIGGMIGASIGSSLDSRLFGGGRRKTEGPRLGDLAIQTASYGAPLPLIFGTMRVAGNVIWSKGLSETRHETRAGGKGGGATQVSYSYSASFAIALSARPIEGVGRVWADGKLLRDSAGQLAVGGAMRIYKGGEGQSPDPLIEAIEGAGAAPAFRGLAYAVFEGLELAEYANRIPNLSFEVTGKGGEEALGQTIAEIAGRAGVLATDASTLSATLHGFAVPRPMAARRALETLGLGFAFDAAEEDGVLRFAGLPRPSSLAVAEDDLGAAHEREDAAQESEPRVTLIRAPEIDLPREVALQHVDPARDYQPGLQRARRRSAPDGGALTLEAPIAMTASAAKQAAEIQLQRAWLRRRARVRLPAKYAALSAGDAIDLPHGGETLSLAIERVSFAPGALDCEGRIEAANPYQSAASADGGAFPAQIIVPPGETTLQLLDLPPLTAAAAAAPIFYAAVAGASAGWRGAALHRSDDGGIEFDPIATLRAASPMGSTTGALNAGPSAYWDRANSLHVTLLNPLMALESRSELAVLNGANAALVGDEIVQFRDAILESDGGYTLSTLLRGRLGTERAIATHTPGERFVLLASHALAEIPGEGSIGRAALFKAASFGAPLDAAPEASFTFTANGLRPFSPVHLTARRAANGDLTVSWIRRTRLGGAWIDGADAPLGEESEAYEIEILSGGAVVRTLASNAPNVIYAAAEQAADFGAPNPAIALRIYQLSARVGRGWPLEGAV